MSEAFDWATIKLVAFDVDGTLYAQRPLRLRMAAHLLWHSLVHFDRQTLAVLKTYRRLREELGDAEVEAFDARLVADVARRHGTSEEVVQQTVEEWMLDRPLRHVSSCRYGGVKSLFDRLRATNRTIGILSDYPALGKLAAMELDADHTVCASDVGVLKPHPRGLERLIEMAGVEPQQTVLIGDRPERDGQAALRVGAHALIRSRKPLEGWRTFAAFDDPIFSELQTRPVEAA